MIRCYVDFFWSNSLAARAHIYKCGEVGCPRFEPRPLHIICNIPINCAEFTGIFINIKTHKGPVWIGLF